MNEQKIMSRNLAFNFKHKNVSYHMTEDYEQFQ